MTRDTDKQYMNAAWLWILGFTVLRLFYARLFLLAPDETNYWQWSRYLDWGYHDQAPMIAWAIRLATMALGHTEVAVRLPSLLAMALASGYLVCISGRWWGPRTAFATAVLTQGIFEFNVGGLMATADGLQAAGWAAAAYHVARGYESHTWRHWLLGGLWFGFGLLSKYTMVLFLPCAFLYGLFSPRHRHRLASVKPYCGVLLGVAVFLPVLYWNAANGWNSARHVAYIGGANEGFSLHLKYLGDLLGSQAALLSPLVFLLILWAWHRVLRKKHGTEKWICHYLFFTSFPMFAFFLLLSFHTRVYGNWPAAAFLTASVLVAALFSTQKKIWKWTLGTAYGFTALVLLQIIWPVVPIPPDMDRTAYELSGWNTLGEAAEVMRQKMPRPEQTFLFGLRYQIASELAFYTPGNPRTVSINRWTRPNVYDYWWRDAELIGMDAVGVLREDGPLGKRLGDIFERVDPPQPLTIYRTRPFSQKREPIKTYYLFRAYGFKGGIHWKPPNPNDIRASDTYAEALQILPTCGM